MSLFDHRKKEKRINCQIVTISDTRTEETDKSGDLIRQLLEEAGHYVISKEIIPDSAPTIERVIRSGTFNPDVDVIITSGGTGIAYRDVTIEAIQPLLQKEIDGFGELFRMLSYLEDIGSAAMMSRAIAGVCNHKAIFAVPGSSGAVKLAMNKLILPELDHVIHEIQKDI